MAVWSYYTFSLGIKRTRMRTSILKKVFIRSNKSIGLIKWIKLTLLESYLGEQLLEMLLAFSSYTEGTDLDAFLPAGSNGYRTENLDDFIAATYINLKLRNYIIELLKIKYLEHYSVLKTEPNSDNGNPEYKLNSEKLYLLTELKLSYNTIWVTLNLIIDVLVYILSGDLATALATGAIIEFVRRFKF
mgnify:CR=1 FL=1